MYEIILNILDNFNFENCGRILNATPPYFCWQLAFYRHLPTSGRQNTVKTTLQPRFVNSAFVALYVSIISPIVPIPISLFVFELEAED